MWVLNHTFDLLIQLSYMSSYILIISDIPELHAPRDNLTKLIFEVLDKNKQLHLLIIDMNSNLFFEA